MKEVEEGGGRVLPVAIPAHIDSRRKKERKRISGQTVQAT